MARSGSAWSIKGIDQETRDVARARAADADLTIGSWIDKIILDQAGDKSDQSDQTAPSGSGRAAAPRPVPASAPSAVDVARHNQQVLDMVEAELDRSKVRLDDALRPVGFALRDLAVRLVAAEQLRRQPSGPVPPRGHISPDIDPTDFSPPAGLAAPRQDPERIPAPDLQETRGVAEARFTEPVVARVEAEADAAPQRPAPQAPLGAFGEIETGEMRPPPDMLRDRHATDTSPSAEETPLEAPDPVPLAAPGLAPDPEPEPDLAPVPPAEAETEVTEQPAFDHARGPDSAPDPMPAPMEPAEEPIEEPIEESAEELPEESPEEPAAFGSMGRDEDGLHFSGVQRGFESDPARANAEARAASRGKTWRVMRVAAAILPVLLISGAVLAYLFADRLGAGPARDAANRTVAAHLGSVSRTFADLFDAARETAPQIPNLIKREIAKLTPPSEDVEVARAPAKTDPAPETGPAAPPAVSTTDQPKQNTGATDSRADAKPMPEPKQSAHDEAPVTARSAPGGSKPAAPVTDQAKPASRASDAPQIARRPPPLPPSLKGDAPRSAALPPPPVVPETKPKTQDEGPTGFADLERSARSGDSAAQHELARRYLEGDGVTRDFGAAANWFREAAIQGAANAQYNLGVLYERGLGVTKDDVRALLWYHSAAEQQHPLAQYNLGIFYLQGRGIPLSYAEASRWFRAASDQGIGKASYNLAVLTEDGLGVARDQAKAMALYEKAASAGEPKAKARLAKLRDTSRRQPKPAVFAETAAAQREGAATAGTVADIQAQLIKDGLYDGRVDGIAGPKTRTAIRAYQRRHALPQTGVPSDTLLNYMRAFDAKGASG